MKTCIFIPDSLRAAGHHLRLSFSAPFEQMSKEGFARAWCAMVYLFPGLHPDDYEASESGWPRVLRRFAAEAWRRAEVGELADDELYCSDVAWCGVYDRMFPHTADEIERRLELASNYGLAREN